MKRVKEFLRLSPAEKRLLLGAAFLVCAVRAGLMVFSFRTLRSSLFRLFGTSSQSTPASGLSVEHISWAVSVACRCVPGASGCLVRALAAELLLAREGHPACLFIGVDGGAGAFAAHAWVESRGRDVTGGGEPGRFTKLLCMDGD